MDKSMSTTGVGGGGQLHRGDEVGEHEVQVMDTYAVLLDDGEGDVHGVSRARWSLHRGDEVWERWFERSLMLTSCAHKN